MLSRDPIFDFASTLRGELAEPEAEDAGDTEPAALDAAGLVAVVVEVAVVDAAGNVFAAKKLINRVVRSSVCQCLTELYCIQLQLVVLPLLKKKKLCVCVHTKTFI